MTTNETAGGALRLRDVLERATCGRCGGTGKYSFNLMDGDRCYGCGGKGTKLTKRGQAASAYWRSLLQLRARDVRVGDKVWYDGLHLPGAIYQRAGWYVVESVAAGGIQRGSIDGVAYERETVAIKIAHPKGGEGITLNEPLDRTLTVSPGDAELQRVMVRSVAFFQGELTKQGKVRKASRLAGEEQS